MKNNKKKLKLYEADTTADAKGVRGYNAFIKPSDVSKYRAQLADSVKRTTGYIMLKEELKKLIKEELKVILKEAKKYPSIHDHQISAPGAKDRPDMVKRKMKQSLTAAKNLKGKVDSGSKGFGGFVSFINMNSSIRMPQELMSKFLDELIKYYEGEAKK